MIFFLFCIKGGIPCGSQLFNSHSSLSQYCKPVFLFTIIFVFQAFILNLLLTFEKNEGDQSHNIGIDPVHRKTSEYQYKQN